MRKKHWTVKNHHQEILRFKRRCIIALALIICLASVLIGRLIYLQVVDHEIYSTLSRQNVLTVIPIEPNRGLIYDRNGLLIAKNLPSFNLSVIPSHITNFKNTLSELQQIIPISKEELALFQKHRSQYRPHQPIPLKVNLTEKQVAKFYLDQYRFPGVIIQSQLLRQYPYTDLLSNVLGYVGRINQEDLKQIDPVNYSASDYIGKTGIEKQYESLLHGQVGYEEVETDASGRTIRTLHRQPPVPGQNLYLTIDAKLQQVAQQALGGESGSVVAVDPNTGDILAMVSNPSYNPNPFVTGISQKDYQALLNAPEHPLYNRDIRGLFAPGSTIKPFYALGALIQNIITPSFRINDRGIFTLPNSSHVFHDWNWKKGGHGIVNVSTAIIVSCDIFFYNLAMKAGISKMDQTLAAFGFGKQTGVDLPREISGIAPSPLWKRKAKGESWFPGDTVNAGIGQGYLVVTPIQLAQATAILANRGNLVPLHLLLKTKTMDGKTYKAIVKPRQMVVAKDPKIWQTVIDAMQKVISSPEGTARYFGKDAPYTAAGKTGTAQVSGLRGAEKETADTPRALRNNHLFISFAPIDHPKIVVAVVMEHALGPDAVARKVIDAYLHTPSKNLAPIAGVQSIIPVNNLIPSTHPTGNQPITPNTTVNIPPPFKPVSRAVH